MGPTDKNSWFKAVSAHDYDAVRAGVDRFRRCVDNNDETALMLATRTNDVKMVEILAKYEAGSFNKNFQTALMIAAARDYSEICKVLAPLEKHVTLPDGRTMLMVAAAAGNYDTVRGTCREFGTERDANDWSALDHACAEGHLDCAKAIARTQAYTVEDMDRAIQIAESFGNAAVADTVREIRNEAELKTRSCKRCQEVQVEMRILEKENRRLNERVQQLEDEGLRLAERLETANSTARGRLDPNPQSLELLYETAKRNLEDKSREYENLREDFITLQNEYQDVRNQLKLMSESVEELTNPNSRLSRRLVSQDAQDEELARLRTENEKLLEDVTRLKRYIDEDVVSTVLFNSVEQNLKNVIALKDEEISRLEGRIQQNCVDVESLEQRVREANFVRDQLTRLQNDYAEARNEAYVQSEAVNELKEELERYKTSDGRSAREMETEVSLLRSQLATKNEEFDVLKNDLYEIIAHTTMSTGNEAGLRSQLEDKDRLISELESKLDIRREECQRLQQRNNDLNSDLTYLTTEMSRVGAPSAPGLEQLSGMSHLGQSRQGMIGGQVRDDGQTREFDASLRASLDTLGHQEVDMGSETLLMKAAASGDVNSVKKLIYQAGTANNLGKTALMYAAEKGHTEIVRLLMLKESRMQDQEGRTALFYASWHRHIACVKLLVDREAGLVKNNGYSSLMVAAVHGYTDVCQLLLAKERGLFTNKNFRHGAGHTALMCAADWGDVACVKLLLSAEAHMRDRKGRMAHNFAKTEEIRDLILNYLTANRIPITDPDDALDTESSTGRRLLERTVHERPDNYQEQVQNIVRGPSRSSSRRKEHMGPGPSGNSSAYFTGSSIMY